MAGNIKGITIEIEGKTTGLSKALGDVNKQSRSLQKELKGVETLLKLDPKNTELVAQKQKILSEQVATTKEKLDRLKLAQAQVNEQYAKGEIGEEQYRDFQREVISTEQKLKKYKTQLAAATKEQNSLQASLEKAGKSLQNVGNKMTDVGKNMSTKVSTPIAAVGVASMAAFKEVDAAMDGIVTATGATGKAAAELQESFKNIAKTMPVDMEVIGAAVGEVNTQFGYTGKQLETTTTQMLKFAEITGSDVVVSTQNAKAAIEAYGLSANDLPMVLDAVARASQDTGLGVDQIYEAVIRGAPQIRAMGLDFATAAQLMGRFEQKGIDSSKALSYLAKAQVSWAKEGKTMKQGLGGLQKQLTSNISETDKLTLASKYFGTKGAVFMLDAIERGVLDFNDLAGSAEHASGTVSSTFEETLDPIDKATIAFNNLKIVGADIATNLQGVLEPAFNKLITGLQKFSDWFTNLPPGIQEFIIVLGLIAAAIGPVLVAAGSLITAISTITAAIAPIMPLILSLLNPITLIVAAVVAAVALIIANWDKIKGVLATIWGAISAHVITPVLNAKDRVIALVVELKDRMTSIFNTLKTFVLNVWNAIKDNIINPIVTAFNTVKQKIDSGIASIQSIFNSFKGIVTSVWNGIKSAIINPVKSAIDTITGFFRNLRLPEIKPPKLKLPHLSISGDFSISPPRVPKFSVKWYDEGGIFTSPQIIGVGERRPEIVGALDDFRYIIRDELRRTQPAAAGGGEVHLHIGTLVADELGLKKLEQTLRKYRVFEDTRRGLR